MSALSAEQIAARWDLASRTYDEWDDLQHGHPHYKQAWADTLTELIGVQPRRDGSPALRVADVGTGTAQIALLLAEMGHDVTGYGIAPAMLARARAKAAKSRLAVSFASGDAYALPLDDGSIDVVVNRMVFWTLYDPPAALLEWRRVLAPGGRIVVIDGCGAPRRQAWGKRPGMPARGRSGLTRAESASGAGHMWARTTGTPTPARACASPPHHPHGTELLDRLLELNHTRHAAELGAGLHDRKRKYKRGRRPSVRIARVTAPADGAHTSCPSLARVLPRVPGTTTTTSRPTTPALPITAPFALRQYAHRRPEPPDDICQQPHAAAPTSVGGLR